MRHFGDQQRASGISDVTSKAHQQSACIEHSVAARVRRLLCEGLNQSTCNDKSATKGCAELSTETIGEVWREGERQYASKTNNGTIEAETGPGGMVKGYSERC